MPCFFKGINMTENTAPSFNRLQVTDPDEMTWKNDQLDRKEYADKLTTLIKNTKGPYVIGLTSPWGSGKTFFLQAWRHQLLEDKKPCIYFNAWEMDASGDPLINLIAVIQKQAQSQDFLSILQSKFKNAKWLPGVLNGAGKVTSLIGLPGADIANAAANIVQNAQNYLNSAKNFKSDLEKTAEKLASQAEGFPLFIMVDELDRCRPSYAIELLERIKHLFNVPHVVFLLAIHSTQLMQQVEHTFGLKPHEKNGEVIQDPRYDYLEKFFDTYYSLPPVDNKKFVKMILSHNERLEYYTKNIFKNSSLSLSDILSSDDYLFRNKNIRSIIHDIEYFSLFIRLYNDLKIEHIILAFWAIFSLSTRENIDKNIGINFEIDIKEYIERKDSLFQQSKNDEQKYFFVRDHFPELKIHAFCTFIFMRARMAQLINRHMTSEYLKYICDCSLIESSLEKATDIAKDVYERLQFLKDFHPVPQEQ